MIEEKIFKIHLLDSEGCFRRHYFSSNTIEEAIENCYQTFPDCTIWEVKYEGKVYRPTTKTITIEV